MAVEEILGMIEGKADEINDLVIKEEIIMDYAVDGNPFNFKT